ncbi:hypothetical protein CEK26_005209 [Fusarium fujikuroi]|nr:hypothetical protein CEK26_005209 [Fusarium fujikuroi]
MRFAAFLSLGLGANIAIASVCKPRSRTLSDSSTVSMPSTGSIALSTTTTDVVIATTTSGELSITIYNAIGWYSPTPPVLTLSIDASTNYVREINTGKYLCVAFGVDGFPNSNMLCNPDSHYAGIEPITCEQTRDRKLKCSAPAGECHLDESSDTTNCWAVSGTWDKFYVIHGRIINTPALVMASSSDLSTPNDMEAIELQLVPYAD